VTVAELIEKLRQFPPETRVFVDGYEGGIADLEPQYVRLVPVKLDVNSESYYGPHEEVGARNDFEPDCDGVLLPRGGW
jgi:hypothetical protein